MNGEAPSDSIVSAAPGQTVAVPLPANINGPNYIGSINIMILANNNGGIPNFRYTAKTTCVSMWLLW
jgi:hypothetical protein